MSALISANDLSRLSEKSTVKVVDATYGQPFQALGIHNAVNFDIDIIADPSAPLAHTVPTAETFARHVGKLGIGNKDTVVVYDTTGIALAAARVWWMFRLFGHDDVKVLNGGLRAWTKAGLPLSPKQSYPEEPFAARMRPDLLKSFSDIQGNIQSEGFLLLDVRDAGRFSGEIPEPRPGIDSGHIPKSLNFPFMTLIDPTTGMLKEKSDLASFFKDLDVQKSIACSCGSGVTACVTALALYELGKKDVAIYDGSWTEWGSAASVPKIKGFGR